MRPARAGLLAVVGAALALAGCYETPSEVAAVSDATRLMESPIADGIYCETSVSFDGDGALEDPDLNDDCLTARFADGELVVTAPESDEAGDEPADAEPPMRFEMAALNRGATLLQTYALDDEPDYSLFVVKATPDAAIVLPELDYTDASVARAAELGVAVDSDGGDLKVLSGAPDDVRTLMDDAAGARFDAAVRDPDVWQDLLTGSIFYIRLDAPTDEVEPDESLVRARVEAAIEALHRATTLE